MSIFYQIFEKSRLTKELISIYKYGSDGSFFCGYVLGYSENLVNLRHFTGYGKTDGDIVMQISDIQSVDFDYDYTRAMQVVIDYSVQIEKENNITYELSDSEDWNYEILKKMEKNFDIITTVEISGEFFTGYILEVSETDFILHCIGKLGEDQNKCVYKIADVNGFRINDIDNRKRAILHKWRQASL